MDRALLDEMRLVAGMMRMGERIAFGRDADLMERAVQHIEALEAAVLAMDAKATPYGPDDHATAYVIPAGPLHRALGVVGHSAARGPVPLPPTRERLTMDAADIGMTLNQKPEPPKAPTFAELTPVK